MMKKQSFSVRFFLSLSTEMEFVDAVFFLHKNLLHSVFLFLQTEHEISYVPADKNTEWPRGFISVLGQF